MVDELRRTESNESIEEIDLLRRRRSVTLKKKTSKALSKMNSWVVQLPFDQQT